MLNRFSAWNDDWNEFFGGLHGFRRDVERALVALEHNSTLDNDLRGPATHLKDAGEDFVVTAYVPGLDDKALTLSLNQDVLTLTGEREVDVPKGYTTHRRERAPFRFSRSFAFPEKVDPEKVNAVLDKGVLTVTVAKSAASKPRAITINAA
jgi:HSP20 family protein